MTTRVIDGALASRAGALLMVFAGVSATFAQPRFVSDVFADTGYERPVIINDRLYFIGDDGTGGEVWSTDGTTRGTRMVEDIWRKPPINNGRGPLSFPQPSGLTQIGDRLMFRATDSDTRVGVWAADDTGAWFVNAERTELSAINFAVFGAFGLFSAFDNSAREDRLWLTNGTKERTHQLGNVEPAYAIPGAQVGDRFFFAGRERQNAGTPFQLWLTDGRARGTRQVGYEGTGALNRVVATGESLFFSTTDNRKKYEVFWVDLTNGGDARMISSYEALSGIVSTIGERVVLWRELSDGTRRLFSWEPGAKDPAQLGEFGSGSLGCCRTPGEFAFAHGRLLFAARDADHGTELWATDGSVKGTGLLKDLLPGAGSSGVYRFMPCGDRHLFAAADGEHGTELWVTDGTAEGTRMVIDMVAGPESSYAAPMGCLGDTAIFTAVRPSLARSIFAVEIERP